MTATALESVCELCDWPGPDPEDRRPANLVIGLHRLREHGIAGKGRGPRPAPTPPPIVDPIVIGSDDDDGPGHPEEDNPAGSPAAAKATGTRRRISDLFGRNKVKGEDKPKPAPRPRSGSRHSLARGAEGLYYRVGRAVVGSGDPRFVPAGRAAQMFAPAAGAHWDELLADTWFDHTIGQPLAARSVALRAVVATLGFPLAVALATARPELWPILEPELEDMLEENIIAMGPALKTRARRRREMQKVLDEMVTEGLLPEGATPKNLLESVIFAPITEEESAPSEPPPYFVRVDEEAPARPGQAARVMEANATEARGAAS